MTLTTSFLLARRYAVTPPAATFTALLAPPQFLSLGDHEKVESVVVGGRKQDFDEKPGVVFLLVVPTRDRCSTVSERDRHNVNVSYYGARSGQLWRAPLPGLL